MQLKRYTDYSLRVLIYLGINPERVVSINEIAQAYGISRNHLLKVVIGLSEQGLIEAYRGKAGGWRLACKPHQINIGKVVEYMEDQGPVIDCHEPECPILPACNLKRALQVAQTAFYQALRQYTLTDLLDKKEDKLTRLLSINHN
jgi:Rrf2 family transcriptional regulator, nitric oxide-sensitive transcriptional repressor